MTILNYLRLRVPKKIGFVSGFAILHPDFLIDCMKFS